MPDIFESPDKGKTVYKRKMGATDRELVEKVLEPVLDLLEKNPPEDLKTRVMKVLHDYYGGSRDDSHKEEIADFIETRGMELLDILKDEFEEYTLN